MTLQPIRKNLEDFGFKILHQDQYTIVYVNDSGDLQIEYKFPDSDKKTNFESLYEKLSS